MPFLTTANHKLHYITAGDSKNPALLMLHGFLGSHQDFKEVVRFSAEEALPTLAPHFYCILPDLPGHGQTLTQPNGYSFETATQTLLALLSDLKIDRTYLLGYSMGGRLALYMVCCFPERFIQIVLESASPGLRTAKEREKRKERDWAIARQLETVLLSEFLSQWYKNPLFDSLREHLELYCAMLARRERNRPLELAKALRGFSTGLQPSLWDALTTLERPVLFLVGEQDRKFVAIAQAMMATCQQSHPRSAVRICSGCGHNVHLESPDSFIQAVIRYNLAV